MGGAPASIHPSSVHQPAPHPPASRDKRWEKGGLESRGLPGRGPAEGRLMHHTTSTSTEIKLKTHHQHLRGGRLTEKRGDGESRTRDNGCWYA